MFVTSSLDHDALEANRNIPARNYWKKRLAGFEFNACFETTDNPLALNSGKNGGEYTITAGEPVYKCLKQVAGSDKSEYIVLLSALGILIQKYASITDLLIFTPVFLHDHFPGTEDLLVPVRMNHGAGISFPGFITALKEELTGDFKHGNYPIGKMLCKEPEELRKLPAVGMMMEGKQRSGAFAHLSADLLFSFLVEDRLVLTIKYNADKFSRDYIATVADRYFNLLNKLLSRKEELIGDIDLLTEAERQQVLVSFNNTVTAYPAEETLVSLFEKQVNRTPDNVAVKWGAGQLSYRELNARSDQVAWFLQKEGIEAGSLVGIMLERDEYLLPGIFGILKAGCAYVPIDPGFPSARINTIVEDAGLQLILSRPAYGSQGDVNAARWVDMEEVLSAHPERPVSHGSAVSSKGLAYVIYTSGSTGKPKGVMITHRSVVNRLWWMQQQYQLHEGDVLLQKTPVVFDVSVWELFWWSFAGASLYLLKPGGEKYPEELQRVIDREKISVIHFVPSMLRQFLAVLRDSYTGFEHLRYVFSSGEALPAELSMLFGQMLHAVHGVRLINLYGPTEATVDVSYYECDFEETGITIPIGKPVANHRLYVLDPYRQLLPVGLPGELYISGVGVAQGYLNNQALTEQKFVKDPYVPGEIMYQTGDLVKWRSDGNLEYLGRLDDQVKIRGFRIEPGEIERHLQQHGAISSVAVIVKERGGDKYLAAYYVSAEPIGSSALRQFLTGRLPAYMIPSYFMRLESLPLTSNGKLNRKAFPDPGTEQEEKRIAPSNEIEQQLALLWSTVLQIKQDAVSVNKSFFEMGGDSIKMLQLNIMINETLKTGISVPEMFQYPTIMLLSKFISSGTNELGQWKAEAKEEVHGMQHMIDMLYKK